MQNILLRFSLSRICCSTNWLHLHTDLMMPVNCSVGPETSIEVSSRSREHLVWGVLESKKNNTLGHSNVLIITSVCQTPFEANERNHGSYYDGNKACHRALPSTFMITSKGLFSSLAFCDAPCNRCAPYGPEAMTVLVFWLGPKPRLSPIGIVLHLFLGICQDKNASIHQHQPFLPDLGTSFNSMAEYDVLHVHQNAHRGEDTVAG